MPLSQAELDQRAAEDLVADQQRTADQQARQLASEQDAAAKTARKAALSDQEMAFRAQGMIPVTTADGNLHPDPLWEQKQAEKAAQEQQEQQAAKLSDQFAREGRKNFVSKVTGLPTALESDEQIAARKKTAADAARKADYNQRITARETAASDPAQKRLPLSAREKLTKELAKTQQDALYGLQSTLQEQAKAVSGGNDYLPFNEAPTPEAIDAQERLARLSQPDAALTDDDLSLLEANDATKPHALKLRNLQAILAKDDAAEKFHAEHETALFDLKLKRDDPAAWSAQVKARRATMTPEQLQADLEASSAYLQTRSQELQAAAAPIQQRRALTRQKLDTLTQQAAERRQRGLLAGEIVTFTRPDGSTEDWPADLAATYEREIALNQDAETQEAATLEQLQSLQDDLQAEAALHDDGAATLATKSQAQQQTAKSSLSSRLRFTPGMEAAAAEIDALQSEAETRKLALDDMYPDGAPPEAIDALNADVQAKVEQAIATKAVRFQSALAAYGDIQSQLTANPDLHGNAGDLFIAARQNLAQDAGIPEAEAKRLLDDAAALDWDQVTADEMNRGLVPEGWKSFGNMNQADDARQTRLLSNGAVIVHPRLTSEKDYTAAVAASGASPDAQAEAIARYPAIRAAQAQNALETIQEVQGVLAGGLIDGANWDEWQKKRPKDVDEAEWALRWTEHNKAQNTGLVGNLISKANQFTRGLFQGGNDLRQQASGILAGLTGSETLMQDAQWAGRKAQAHESAKTLGGNTSDNFFTRGVFDQLPRLGSSLIPAVGGAKAAQAVIRLFAATKLGTRFLPSLAAALERAATPAQAVKAISTLTRAGLGGAATAGAGQTYGAQIADIYGTLRKEHPEMDHVTALKQAQMPAIVSGLATALLTVGFGATGVSRLITRPAEAKALAAKVFKGQMQRLGFAADAFIGGGIMETIEETLDEGISQVAAAIGKGHSVQTALGDFFRMLPDMAVATMLMGGAGEGLAAHQASSIQQPLPTPAVNLPETNAAAWAEIDALGNLPGHDPAQVPDMQNRAAVALAVAQGGSLEDLEEWQLNAVGWTGRNAKGQTLPPGQIVQLKDYAGPEVLEVDTQGNATIAPSYRTALETHLPAVARAITLQPQANALASPPASRIQHPASSAQPQPAADQSPAPNAAPSSVQAPAQSGPQTPPSQQTPPPASNAPVAQGEGSSLTPSADPAHEQRAAELATLLESRGLTPPQALAAAQHVVKQQGIVGASAEEQYTAGIDDAMQQLHWIRGTGKNYAFIAPALNATPPEASSTQGVGASSPQPGQPAASQDSSKSSPTPEDSSAPAAEEDADSDPAPDIGRMQTVPPVSVPEESGVSQRDAESADEAHDSFARHAVKLGIPANRADALARQWVEENPIDPSKYDQQRREFVEWLKHHHVIFNSKAQAGPAPTLESTLTTNGSYTTAEAKQLAADYETEFGDSLPQAIADWIAGAKSRKNLDPASFAAKQKHFLQWVAERETAARGGKLAKATTAVSAPSTLNSQLSTPAAAPIPTPSRPDALRRHQAWIRARTQALAGTPKDQRPQARQILNELENSIAANHALFKALALGLNAQQLLGRNADLGVTTYRGETVLALNLPGILRQFANIHDLPAGVRAALLEEAIHAAALGLAQTDPKRYGYRSFVDKWNRLPAALRLKVWKSYKGVDIQLGTASKLPVNLSENDQWHMFHEFVRMLVQDKFFAKQVSEVAAQDKGLAQWLIDLLKDIGAKLRELLNLASPELKADIEGMVDQIGAVMQSMQQASAESQDRLVSLKHIVIPSNRTQSALANGTLLAALGAHSPAFSHDTLGKLWDKLPQPLQDLVYSRRPGQDTRSASKTAMMRHLLTALAADPQFAHTALSSLVAQPPAAANLLTSLLSRLKTAFAPKPEAPPDVVALLQATPAEVKQQLQLLHTQVLKALADLHDIKQGIIPAAPPDVADANPTPPPAAATSTDDDTIPMSWAAAPPAALGKITHIDLPPPVPGDGIVTLGSKGQTVTPDGQTLDFQWAVVEAANLVPSHDPNGKENASYPQHWQDRGEARSQPVHAPGTPGQEIMQRMSYPLLSGGDSAGNGAPLVMLYPEADTDSSPAPQKLVSIAGTNRIRAQQAAWATQQPTTAAYKAALLADAKAKGLDPAKVTAAQQPVLVRILISVPDNVEALAKLTNQSTIAARTPLETARDDASKLTPEILSELVMPEDGDIFTPANNPFFIQFFRENVPAADYESLTVPVKNSAARTLSSDGKTRIARALFVKAYGDSPAALSTFDWLNTASAESDFRNLRTALLALSPYLSAYAARFSAGSLDADYQLAPDLIAGADIYRHADSLDADLPGVDLPRGTDQQLALAKFFAANKRHVKRVVQTIYAYHEAVDRMGDPRMADIFGPAEKITPTELWNLAANYKEPALAMGRKNVGDAPDENVNFFPDALAGMIDRDRVRGPNWYASTITKIRKALARSQPVTITSTEITDYGGKLVANVAGQELPLTHGKVRHSEMHFYFGHQQRKKIEVQPAPSSPPVSYTAFPTGNNPNRWQNLTPQQQMAATAPGAQVTIARDGTATILPPATALKLYRTLTAKAQEAGTLTPPQSRALERAESSLGQSFLFDTPNPTLKPAEDLVLEQQTARQAAPPEEQLKLFKGTTAPAFPRASMPQIPVEQRSALLRYLRTQHIPLKRETVPAASLKPSQSEILPEKLEAAAAKTAPRDVLISQDNYVLDGHHQWQTAGQDVPVIRLGVPVRAALAALDAFPGNTAPRPTASRFDSAEYPYLGPATTDRTTATDPEAAVVNPLTATSPDGKVAELMALSRANIPLIDRILGDLRDRLQLDGKWSLKDPDRIMAKASRPSIRAEKPWHDIEHVRDGLRFKVSLDDFRKLPAIMSLLRAHGVTVVKFDTKKMFAPKMWGWRFVAWDLRLPNGQLVEFYAPIPELEAAKDENHLIFEKWRNLPPAQYAYGMPLFSAWSGDVQLSNQRYTAAFMRGLQRMGYADLSAAEASWNKLVARASSVTSENRSMPATADGGADSRQAPALSRMAPGGATYASPESTSSNAMSGISFTVEDSTDNDGIQGENEPSTLAKGTTTPTLEEPGNSKAGPEEVRAYQRYWINKEGIAYPVSDHLAGAQHAKATSADFDSRNTWGYYEMWQRGWARIATEPGEIFVDMGESRQPNSRQMRWLNDARTYLATKTGTDVRLTTAQGGNMLQKGRTAVDPGYRTPASMLSATAQTIKAINLKQTDSKLTPHEFATKDLHAAYRRAKTGSSTAMLPIRRVFDAAKAKSPGLSAAEFMAQVKADYYAGLVMLEPSETSQATQSAGTFTLRDSLGVVNTGMSFIPTTEDEMIEAAEASTDTPEAILNEWAKSGETLSAPPSAEPSPGGLSEAEVMKVVFKKNIDPSAVPFKESEQERGRIDKIKKAYGGDANEVDWSEQPKPIISYDEAGDLQVEDGHHRLTAWRELGFRSVPAIFVPRDIWAKLEKRHGLSSAGMSVADFVGDPYTSGQDSYQGAKSRDIEDLVDDHRDNLNKGRTAVDPGPDLFAFNTGMGLGALLTPAQNESKIQQAKTLDLFGGTPNAQSRPASQRPARPARPSRPQEATGTAPGIDDLFAGPGMAGDGLDGNGPLFDGTGQSGSLGGSRNPALGGGTTRQPGSDGSGEGQSQDRPGDRVPGLRPDGENPAASRQPEPAAHTRPGVGSSERNFEVPDNVESLAPTGNKAKILANQAAIKLLKKLEDEQRNATPEEKQVLAAYTGWGAFKEAFNEGYEDHISRYWDHKSDKTWMPKWLSSWQDNHRDTHKLLKEAMTQEEFDSAALSTLNAHFTAAPVIRAMWQMVERLGFKGGRAMEPAAGNGHFLGLQPRALADRTRWQTSELDELTTRLLSKLYPEATVNDQQGGNPARMASGMGFQEVRVPNGSLDLFISNVPFHQTGPKKKGFPSLNLHNFFFAHALDKVKPGGLVAFITSDGTMQNRIKQREFIASKGDLVAAFRLPNNAFKANAGTEVTTDIIIIRKPDGTPFKGESWRDLVEVGRSTVTLKQGKDQLIGDLRKEAERLGTPTREHGVRGAVLIDVSAPIMVNEYFVNHPQNVLGTHTLEGSMYRGGSYAVQAPEGMDVMKALEALIPSLPANIMGQQAPAANNAGNASKGDKPFSHIERAGKIYEVQPDGSLEEADWGLNPEFVKVWRSWQTVHAATQELIEASIQPGAKESHLDALRARLNVVYDTHVGKNKAISRRHPNTHSFLYGDPAFPLTAALENEKAHVNPKTGGKTYSYTKADILTNRITPPIAAPTTAANIREALETSLAWKGTLQPTYMATLLRTDSDTVRQLLDAETDVFADPATSTYETAESYLSGNVRAKLDIAEDAAKTDPKFNKNVAALTQAMPERKSIGRITPTLGARWLPMEVYNAFIADQLGGKDTVTYEPAGNLWNFHGTHLFTTEDFGTEKAGPYTLMKHALNMTEPLIYDGTGDDKALDHQATAAARHALDKMRQAFITFVKSSEVPVTIMPDEDAAGAPTPDPVPVWQASEDAFNITNNSYVNPVHKGEYLQFPGLNTNHVHTKPFRRAVLARFLSLRRGMMAHGVGSGKSFNLIMLAYELKRLALAQKPMIVVQNSTLGQFAKSYMQAYPTARVLVPTSKDFEKQNIRRLVAKIATGNWDTVILPHSKFDLISNKASAVKDYMDSQIQELKEALTRTKDESKVRNLQTILLGLKERRTKMLNQLAERADNAVFWEDLGVDAILMDEAHNYKSLPIITRMGRVKGVPSGADSQRAINFMLKVRDVQKKTGGKNIFLATGTPVKNSIAEAFIMMQFMAPDILEDYGLRNFDDFATSFGLMVTAPEMAWSGTPKMESRFVKFQNGPALITMIRSMFDVAMGNEALGLDVPAIAGGEAEMKIIDTTPSNDQFNAWVRNVGELWKNASKEEKEIYGAAPIQTMAAGIAAALDPRLISPTAPDHADSKVNTALRRVVEIYQSGHERKTTQLIFSDLRNQFKMDYLVPFTGHPFPAYGSTGEFDLYKDMQKKLIASGVKPEHILLMESGWSDAKKTALFAKVSSGEIRIVIGSTELLGVGVNVQERLKAVHHLMPPRDFTPAMQEQRNGRIIRQGNMHAAKVEGVDTWNEPVFVINYGTEGSMDSAIYSALARKQRAITQLLMGEDISDVFDDPTDPMAVNLAEMAARTLGDLDFIRKIELEKEIKDLRLLRDAHLSEHGSRKSRLLSYQASLRNAPLYRAHEVTKKAAAEKLWVRTAPRPEGVREETDISDSPVYEFGGQVIDTAAPDFKGITNLLGLWLREQSIIMGRAGQKRKPLTLHINGKPVFIEVHEAIGEDTPGSILDSEGAASTWGNSFNGPAGLIHLLRGRAAVAQDSIDQIDRDVIRDTAAEAKLSESLSRATAWPDHDRLAALEAEDVAVSARLAEKAVAHQEPDPNAPKAPPKVNGQPLGPMTAPDPEFMTPEVQRALQSAVITANRLVLPDTLDRKLYEQVNRALESAGGRWSKKVKAHVFLDDPSTVLGLTPAEEPENRPERLAKGRGAVYVPPHEHAEHQLDRRTAGKSFIGGSRVTREQGRALRDVHQSRLATGPLREGSPFARPNFDWTPGPALAQQLSHAFGVPVLTPAQEQAILALPVNDSGVEAKVYLDHEHGVIYKRLQTGAGAPSGGIWPHLNWTSLHRLDWHYQPADNPRQTGIRLAVMTDLGGTPTEIAAIGPQGHIILKQPLSPRPDIGTFTGRPQERMAHAQQRSGIVPVPDALKSYDGQGVPVGLVLVGKRPWLVFDTKPDNFIGDHQGNVRINDPVFGQLTTQHIRHVPGLAAIVREAAKTAQSLGDRSDRLFMGTKRVNSPMASDSGAAQSTEPSPGGLSEADALFQRLSEEYDEDLALKRPEFDPYQGSTTVDFEGRKWKISISSNWTFRAEDADDSNNWFETDLDEDLAFSSNSYQEGDVPANIEDIWEKAPKDWFEPPVSDEDDRESWADNQPSYAVQTNNGESGWQDDDNFIDLRKAVAAYVSNAYEDKRLIFYNGRTTRDKDRYGFYGEQPSFEVLALPSFVQKLLRDFPGMTREEAQDIAATRNNDNTDTFLVAQAYARHRYTDYDDRLKNAAEMGEDTSRERSKARFELRQTIDSVMERWSNPPQNDEAAKVSQGGPSFDSPRAAGGTLAKASTSPSLPVSQSPSPLAKIGWNHLDRAASAKLAAHTRWLTTPTHALVSRTAHNLAGNLVAMWTGSKDPAPFLTAAHALKREFFPDSVMPREVLAKKREMEIKTAMGSQRAMDLVRALAGNPKFSDLAYPKEFAENPMHRRNLYEAMTGERPMSSLPPELQALAAKLRGMLVDIGKEAVKQGRMSTETFDNLRAGYMPHYYKEDVQKEQSLFHKFRLGVRDILAQRTTAWHITDTSQKDKNGDHRLVSHTGNQWRFRNQEHMNAFFEDFITQQALSELQSRYGKKYRSLTAADLMTPSKLDPEVRGRLQEIKRTLHQRYDRRRPLTIAEQEKAGLIMDPVYAIARYAAQMAHDNSTAEWFNFVAADPANISTIATPGFTEIPDNPRFGRLAGKFVQNDIANQVLEMIEAPNIALQIYDTTLGWWKAGKTVLNPGTHVRNVLGNLFFSQLAGNSVWNPGNATYYAQALTALRQGGPVLTEAYDAGVLGADFVSAELRQTLRQLLPDPATIVDDGKAPSLLMGIGKAIGKYVGNPANAGFNKIAALYQAEDEIFKLAAYLKAKQMLTEGSAGTPARSAAAAAHIRKWFPFFDSGSSGTLKLIGRTAMPFLGFYRESIRIFGHALKERPLALAAGLSVPSLITMLSAMALGLDDDDLDEVKKDMRGKTGKLLGFVGLDGKPWFSMLLPFRGDTGQIQQFDISAVHPFVDFMGTRVEGGQQDGWWPKMFRSFVAAGPLGNLLYSNMTGEDAFFGSTIVEPNMTTGEAALARVSNAAKTLLPPLVPGGTGFNTLLNMGSRSSSKTLEVRSPSQAMLRTVGGLDVRNATPDLYRLADDWRKAHGYEVTEGMDYGSTTPASRARKALFSVLAQDTPNPTAIKNILAALDKMGHPVRTEQDVNRLLFYRDPLKLIGGNKAKGITASAAQAQFRASLQGEARAAFEQSLQEYRRIQQRAPLLIRAAQ